MELITIPIMGLFYSGAFLFFAASLFEIYEQERGIKKLLAFLLALLTAFFSICCFVVFTVIFLQYL